MGLREVVGPFAHSGLFLSVGALLAAFPICDMLGLSPSVEILLLFFFGTFAFYTANRYLELTEDLITYPERSKFINSKRWVLLSVALLSYFATFIISAMGGLYPLLLFASATTFIFFYSTAVLKIRIKNIMLLKNISIALFWAVIFTFMPLFFAKASYSVTVLPPFLLMFALTFVNTILFDIRDVAGDKKNGVTTIPIWLGVERTIRYLRIALLTFLLSILLSVLAFNLPVLTALMIIILPTFAYLYGVTSMVGRLDMRILADFLGDGWLVLYGILGILHMFLIG